jgi:hypothetical protein
MDADDLQCELDELLSEGSTAQAHTATAIPTPPVKHTEQAASVAVERRPDATERQAIESAQSV